MSEQYEYPDGPEVFARILEQFRNIPVAYWEARIAQYTKEARAQAKAEQTTNPGNVPVRKRKSTIKKVEA